MPTKFQRITNGMRAAVCGLMIAGVRYETACRIADAPEKSLRRLMPEGWHRYKRSPYRWKGQELEDLRNAYDDWNLKVRTISELFGIAPTHLRKLRKIHGWRVRPNTMRVCDPKAIANQPVEKQRLYEKLRPVVGREAALREVFRHG